MKLINVSRTQLEKHAGLNAALDGIADRANVWARVEHRDDGTHGAVTAESVTIAEELAVEGAVTGNLRLEGLLIFSDDEADLNVVLSRSTVSSVPVLQFTGNVVPNTDNTYLVGMPTATIAGAYERGRSAAMGAYAAITFNAGNFSGNGGTWTVIAANQVSLTQARVGTSCRVNASIQNTNVAAGSTQLRITVPTALVAGGRFGNAVARAVDAGTVVAARVVIDASVSTTTLLILKADGTNWTATAANDTAVEFQIDYESAS